MATSMRAEGREVEISVWSDDLSEGEEPRPLTFNRLLVLLDDDEGLVRLGLGTMEALAKAEGRILWH